MKFLSIAGILFCGVLGLHADNAPPATPVTSPVQVDVSKVLNARIVTTLTDGKVVPFEVTADDHGGLITKAAAAVLGNSTPHVLPDNGRFPATDDHPEVVLNFSNTNGKDFQVRRSPNDAQDDFSFDVPARNYAQMFLFFSECTGWPAKIHLVLTYQDGSTEERDLTVPFWWRSSFAVKDPDYVYLATDLSKWDKDKMKEWNGHGIYGFDLHPASGKVLTQISAHKTTGLLVFWGATGQPAN